MTSTVIQAGGQSNRIGEDKALALLAGMPLIEHVHRRVKGLTDEVLITSNSPAELEYLNLRVVPDIHPERGSLFGLHTALQASQGPIVLIVGCDMPFLNRDLLQHLLENAGNADVVIPEWQGNLEPLHAVYRRETCLNAVTIALEAGERRMVSFFPDVNLRVIEEGEVAQFDPGGESFFNINTPEDLAEGERILARLGVDRTPPHHPILRPDHE